MKVIGKEKHLPYAILYTKQGVQFKYTNVASTTLISKLNLCIVKHIRPYRLQWLNDSGKVK
jgi:hypothetical protein